VPAWNGHCPYRHDDLVGASVATPSQRAQATPIESAARLKSPVARLKPGDPVVLRIERLGQFQYLAFEIE
jgi:hypothetical protein